MRILVASSLIFLQLIRIVLAPAFLKPLCNPNIPSEIKNKLTDQCNRIEVTGIQIDCYIDQTDDGTNALVVKVTGTDKLGYGSQSGNVIIGISYDKLNRLYVRKSYI